jgi:hypothetical protein
VATIVLVVGTTGSLTSGDTVIQGRLVAAGHTVVLRNDEDAEYASAYDGVVVSDSSSGGTVGAKYDTVAKPAITHENTTWRLGTYLGAISGTQWTLENVPAANAGLTGTHTVYTSSQAQQGIDTDTLPAGATVVARLAGDADHGTYVIYPSGIALTSGTAPAKRVFLRMGDAQVAAANATGLAIIDAAITWAFGVPSTTFSKTGAAARTTAGSGAKSVIVANFVNKAGRAASVNAGSGAKALGRAHTKAGGAARVGAGSGAKVVDAHLLPSQVLDLSYWHLTTPEDSGDGDAEQINQPELDGYESDGFYVDEQNRVVCIADVNGFTTSGASGATRRELRQRRKGTYALAAMDPNAAGRWQMTGTSYVDATSITGGTTPRKEGIFAQIHGAGDSPIPLILAAEYHVSPARIRIYKNGPGFANPVTSITPDTPISYRIRIGGGRLKLWVIAGLHTDLPDPVTSTAPYDWPISDFTDQVGWYFKDGGYNKTPITSGSSGQFVSKVAYLNVLEPSDPEEQTSTTYVKTGGAAASRAGSGAKTLIPATVRTKGGGASPAAAGSGAAVRVPATVHTRTGGAAGRGVGSGSDVLTPAAVHAKTGGATATGSAAGARARTHVRAGAAATRAAATGARSLIRSRSGGAATASAGSGASARSSAVVYVKAGGASPLGVAIGHQEESVVHARTGGAAAPAVGVGALDFYEPTTHDRTGCAATTAAGTGQSDVQSAAVYDRTGGAATSPDGSGARSIVRTRTGGASAAPAGVGAAEHVPATVHVRTGGAAVSAVGSGQHEHDGPAGHSKTGGGASSGAASGVWTVTSAQTYEKAGGAAVRGTGIGLVEVIEPTVHLQTGGTAVVTAGSGRGRVGGRMQAGVPVALGQLRSGTPVRR